MLRLVIEDDEGKTTVVPLIRDEITIGRKEGNTIRLTEKNVSRRHARLLRTTGPDPCVIVEDLDSYNGIKLNGDKVTGRCTMRPGDLIQIGDYSLALKTDQPAEERQTRPAPAVGDAKTQVAEMPTTVTSMPDEQLGPNERARLVAVSSNLAGEEFIVDRREVIMGRTDENDVVVNHRSISRNHAKIVARNGTFTIIDLASSNGVRVNGDDFGTTALVNGDIIELGNVKLRFVGPGDDYVFVQADIIEDDLEMPSNAGRNVALVLVMLVVGVGAFLGTRSCDEQVAGPDGEAVTGAPTQAETPKAAPPTPPPAPAEDLSELIRQAESHLSGEKWVEAEAVARRVLQSEADHVDATRIADAARREAGNKERLDAIQGQVSQQQWGEAFVGLTNFPSDSAYTERARALRPKVEKGFADSELERGKMLLEDEDTEGARQVWKDLDSEAFAAKQARELKKAIDEAERAAEGRAREAERERERERERAAERERPPEAAARRQPAPPRREAPRRSQADKDEEYEALMKEAVDLVVKARRAEAARVLERALKVRPGAKLPHQRLCAILPIIDQPKKALRHCKAWLSRERDPSVKPRVQQVIDRLEGQLGR